MDCFVGSGHRCFSSDLYRPGFRTKEPTHAAELQDQRSLRRGQRKLGAARCTLRSPKPHHKSSNIHADKLVTRHLHDHLSRSSLAVLVALPNLMHRLHTYIILYRRKDFIAEGTTTETRPLGIFECREIWTCSQDALPRHMPSSAACRH